MNATTVLVHLVRAPRSAIVHVSRSGELTACGRDVPDTWSSELMEPAGALERTTCERCQSYGWTLPQPATTAELCTELDALIVEQDHAAALELNADLPVDRTPLTLLVVPCSGAKLEQPAPARELYRGTLTTMGLAACSVVEGSAEYGTGHAGTRTMILSALHGLLDLDTVVAPYDVRMGASESISTAELVNQLRATGATRLVALTPNAYTNALRAACELAGVELVAALEGCRGIGDQRGRLAQLRRSGGYGAGLGLETRRMVQEHTDALAEDRARTADAQQTPRCRQPLAGTGGEPCQAPAGHDGRGYDASGQPWSHCSCHSCRTGNPCIGEGSAFWRDDAPELVHLMGGPTGLLDECESAPRGRLVCTPVHADVTCERCRELIPTALEREHAEALVENAAHDAAAAAAQELTPELLQRYMDRPRPPQNPMPRAMRYNRTRSTLQLVPPQ